jgi:hypothetical protein
MAERNTLLVATALIALTGFAGFAAWGAQGGAMFVALVENGLAWCF